MAVPPPCCEPEKREKPTAWVPPLSRFRDSLPPRLGRAARQRASRITASELRCNMGGGRAVARARGITTTDASARSVPPPRTAGPRRVSARRARAAGPALEVGGKRRRRAVGPPRVRSEERRVGKECGSGWPRDVETQK